MIAIEKSLPKETKKKIGGVALGKNLVKSDKNVVAITFFQINFIKNVGTNLKTGVSLCCFERTGRICLQSQSRNLHFVTALVKRL